MNNGKMVLGVCAAAALAAVAYFTGDNSSRGGEEGRTLLPDLDLTKVASVEIGSVKLVGGENGWTIPTAQDYPANVGLIRETILRLKDDRIRETVKDHKMENPVPVVMRDAEGRELASVLLGDGGHRGRYISVKGETVRVGSTYYDLMEQDWRLFAKRVVIDEPQTIFSDLADPSLTEEELGFATGVVAKVAIAGDTNRTATVGAEVKGGNGDRYMKLDGVKWTYVISSYDAEKLLPKAPPKEEEPEEEEPTEAPKSKDAAEKPAAAPEAAPEAETASEQAAN